MNWKDSGYMYYSSSSSWHPSTNADYGDWCNNQFHFLGVRIPQSQNTFIYGWVKLNCEIRVDAFAIQKMDLGIKNLNKHKLKIYPQPAQNEIFVSEMAQGKKSLRLLNLLGKVVWHKESWLESEKIDLSDLPKGMYILEVQTESNRFTEKVLKE